MPCLHWSGDELMRASAGASEDSRVPKGSCVGANLICPFATAQSLGERGYLGAAPTLVWPSGVLCENGQMVACSTESVKARLKRRGVVSFPRVLEPGGLSGLGKEQAGPGSETATGGYDCSSDRLPMSRLRIAETTPT